MIKRTSHVLWFDMIYIQRVVCFLPSCHGSGIENTQVVEYKPYQATYDGISYIYCVTEFYFRNCE